MEYTDSQMKLIKGIKSSFNYLHEETNLQDNANYCSYDDVKAILGCNVAQACGHLVALQNKGILFPDEVNGDPIYMVSNFGVKEAFRLYPDYEEKILPCPFCESEAKIVELQAAERMTYLVQCDSCLAETTECDNSTEAVALWNRRIK